MTELQINLSISSLTLVVASSIGMAAEGLSRYFDKLGNESSVVEYKIPRTDVTAPMNVADTNQETVPTSGRVAMQ